MSDTITKWHEMQEEKILSDQGGEYIVPKKGDEPIAINEKQGTMYIFVLDFLDGKAYRYDISALCNDKNWSSPGYWNPDSESCEAFLIGAGHNINNIEWMVTNQEFIQRGN